MGDFVKKKEPQLPHLKDYFSSPERLRETACLVVACFFGILSSQTLSITVSQFLLLAIAQKSLQLLYIYLYNYIYFNTYKRVLAWVGAMKKTVILGYWDN